MEDLNIIVEDGFLFFQFSGTFNVENGLKVVDAMSDACIQYECFKALLDCRPMVGEMPIMQRYRVVEYAEKTREIKMKTAIVVREDQTLPDNFVENVAYNRGINLRIFTDFDQAVNWLRG